MLSACNQSLRLSPLTFLLLVAIIAAILGSIRGEDDIPCPSRCRACDGDNVDCSRSSLVAPPRRYPNGTRVLNLENNYIRVLGHRSFRPLPTLEVLKAAGNRITTLTNDAFGRPFENLKTLELTGNRINRIYRRALRGMGHLRTLVLNQNRIRSLQRIFHGTPNLYQLNLASNKIARLGANDLSPLTSVHYVDLRDNRISTINPRAFKDLDKLRYLFLNNNPITRLPAMQWSSQVLKMVDLSHCKLGSVPKPFPASVTDLRLGHNLITQVNHTDFEGMTELQMLALNNNQLTFMADGALSHLTHLVEVWLRNNRLVYIPRDMPDNVKRVYMDFNNVQEVESGIFGENSQLDFLTVQSNHVNRIQPNTFRGLRFLNTINFQGNALRVLEPNSFVGLGSLATLLLSNNPLERIDEGAFRNLANLSNLHMSYVTSETFTLGGEFLSEMLRLQSLQLMNSPGLAQRVVETIESAHHAPLERLTDFDLSYNNLDYLPPNTRQLFPNLRSLPMDGNPFHCSRRLRWLQSWMSEEAAQPREQPLQFYRQEEPTCNQPYSLNGRTIMSVRDQEWGEDSQQGSGSNTRSGSSGGEVFLSDQPIEMRMGNAELSDTRNTQNFVKGKDDVMGPASSGERLYKVLKNAEESQKGFKVNLQGKGVERGTNKKERRVKNKDKVRRRKNKKERKGRKGRRDRQSRKERRTRRNQERKRRRRMNKTTKVRKTNKEEGKAMETRQ